MVELERGGGTWNGGGRHQSTKWDFAGFELLDVKALLHRLPLVGTGPLLEWLRNLAHTRQMVALDTFHDNLCLWRCLPVYQGARVECSTADAKRLAQGFFNRPCQDCPKASLDELDKVEWFLNKNKPFKEWTGIRVYEPERQDDGSVIWRLW